MIRKIDRKLLLAVLIFGIVPLFISDKYFMQLLTTCMVNIILYLGLNLLVGLSGQVSLGQAAFYGLGAYTAAILSTKLHLPMIVTIPCGIIMCVVVGALLGLPAARLKGPYLTMTTLGFTQLFNLLLINLSGITNGPGGIGGIGPFRFLGLTIRGEAMIYLFMFIFVLVSIVLFNNIKHSPLGRGWRAIRDSSIAAEAMGIDITKYNILAFSICSAFAGLAGVLWAYYITYISPDQFSLTSSFSMVSILIIGGRGSVLGTIIAAILQTFVPEYLRVIGDWRFIVFSLMLIVVVIFAPDGLVGIINNIKVRVDKKSRK